jgi:hypothetical protein
MKKGLTMQTKLIAPCGMNCGICLGYLLRKEKCHGCNDDNKYKTAGCVKCRIKNCVKLKDSKSKFCFDCDQFPCARIKHLDKRYKTKYEMSMIENLENIKKLGIRKFVKNEKLRWTCTECGGTICVHKKYCVSCKKPVISNV